MSTDIEASRAWDAVSLMRSEVRAETLGWTRCHRFDGTARMKTGLISSKTIRMEQDFNGCWLATNQRLLFVARVGWLNPSYRLSASIPYEQILGVIAKSGWFHSNLVVMTEKSTYSFQIDSGEGNRLQKFVEGMKWKRQEEIWKEEKKGQVKIVVDFSFLRSLAEKGGIILQDIACPFCNGKIKLPETGDTSTCSYCGREIYAVDIFAKIRQTLSGLDPDRFLPPPPPT